MCSKQRLKISIREQLLKSRTDCDTKMFLCLKCDTNFSSIKTLYFHMFTIHADIRLYYMCPICSITFVQVWSVCRHLMKVHKKTKDEVESLKSHIKSTQSANKEVPHLAKVSSETECKIADYKTVTCLYCARNFSTPANLRRHTARHLGLTRFFCVLCNYKAFNRSECHKHIRKIHSSNEPNKFTAMKVDHIL